METPPWGQTRLICDPQSVRRQSICNLICDQSYSVAVTLEPTPSRILPNQDPSWGTLLMPFSSWPWAHYQIRKIASAHAPGMPGTFSPPPRVSDPGMHHETCVTHVPWCMLGWLTNYFLWRRWRGKRSRHSRRMHNPKFCVSGKRPVRSALINLDRDPGQHKKNM